MSDDESTTGSEGEAMSDAESDEEEEKPRKGKKRRSGKDEKETKAPAKKPAKKRPKKKAVSKGKSTAKKKKQKQPKEPDEGKSTGKRKPSDADVQANQTVRERIAASEAAAFSVMEGKGPGPVAEYGGQKRRRLETGSQPVEPVGEPSRPAPGDIVLVFQPKPEIIVQPGDIAEEYDADYVLTRVLRDLEPYDERKGPDGRPTRRKFGLRFTRESVSIALTKQQADSVYDCYRIGTMMLHDGDLARVVWDVLAAVVSDIMLSTVRASRDNNLVVSAVPFPVISSLDICHVYALYGLLTRLPADCMLYSAVWYLLFLYLQYTDPRTLHHQDVGSSKYSAAAPLALNPHKQEHLSGGEYEGTIHESVWHQVASALFLATQTNLVEDLQPVTDLRGPLSELRRRRALEVPRLDLKGGVPHEVDARGVGDSAHWRHCMLNVQHHLLLRIPDRKEHGDPLLTVDPLHLNVAVRANLAVCDEDPHVLSEDFFANRLRNHCKRFASRTPLKAYQFFDEACEAGQELAAIWRSSAFNSDAVKDALSEFADNQLRRAHDDVYSAKREPPTHRNASGGRAFTDQESHAETASGTGPFATMWAHLLLFATKFGAEPRCLATKSADNKDTPCPLFQHLSDIFGEALAWEDEKLDPPDFVRRLAKSGDKSNEKAIGIVNSRRFIPLEWLVDEDAPTDPNSAAPAVIGAHLSVISALLVCGLADPRVLQKPLIARRLPMIWQAGRLLASALQRWCLDSVAAGIPMIRKAYDGNEVALRGFQVVCFLANTVPLHAIPVPPIDPAANTQKTLWQPVWKEPRTRAFIAEHAAVFKLHFPRLNPSVWSNPDHDPETEDWDAPADFKGQHYQWSDYFRQEDPAKTRSMLRVWAGAVAGVAKDEDPQVVRMFLQQFAASVPRDVRQWAKKPEAKEKEVKDKEAEDSKKEKEPKGDKKGGDTDAVMADADGDVDFTIAQPKPKSGDRKGYSGIVERAAAEKSRLRWVFGPAHLNLPMAYSADAEQFIESLRTGLGGDDGEQRRQGDLAKLVKRLGQQIEFAGSGLHDILRSAKDEMADELKRTVPTSMADAMRLAQLLQSIVHIRYSINCCNVYLMHRLHSYRPAKDTQQQIYELERRLESAVASFARFGSSECARFAAEFPAHFRRFHSTRLAAVRESKHRGDEERETAISVLWQLLSFSLALQLTTVEEQRHTDNATLLEETIFGNVEPRLANGLWERTLHCIARCMTAAMHDATVFAEKDVRSIFAGVWGANDKPLSAETGLYAVCACLCAQLLMTPSSYHPSHSADLYLCLLGLLTIKELPELDSLDLIKSSVADTKACAADLDDRIPINDFLQGATKACSAHLTTGPAGELYWSRWGHWSRAVHMATMQLDILSTSACTEEKHAIPFYFRDQCGRAIVRLAARCLALETDAIMSKADFTATAASLPLLRMTSAVRSLSAVLYHMRPESGHTEMKAGKDTSFKNLAGSLPKNDADLLVDTELEVKTDTAVHRRTRLENLIMKSWALNVDAFRDSLRPVLDHLTMQKPGVIYDISQPYQSVISVTHALVWQIAVGDLWQCVVSLRDTDAPIDWTRPIMPPPKPLSKPAAPPAAGLGSGVHMRLGSDDDSGDDEDRDDSDVVILEQPPPQRSENPAGKRAEMHAMVGDVDVAELARQLGVDVEYLERPESPELVSTQPAAGAGPGASSRRNVDEEGDVKIVGESPEQEAAEAAAAEDLGETIPSSQPGEVVDDDVDMEHQEPAEAARSSSPQSREALFQVIDEEREPDPYLDELTQTQRDSGNVSGKKFGDLYDLPPAPRPLSPPRAPAKRVQRERKADAKESDEVEEIKRPVPLRDQWQEGVPGVTATDDNDDEKASIPDAMQSRFSTDSKQLGPDIPNEAFAMQSIESIDAWIKTRKSLEHLETTASLMIHGKHGVDPEHGSGVFVPLHIALPPYSKTLDQWIHRSWIDTAKSMGLHDDVSAPGSMVVRYQTDTAIDPENFKFLRPSVHARRFIQTGLPVGVLVGPLQSAFTPVRAETLLVRVGSHLAMNLTAMHKQLREYAELAITENDRIQTPGSDEIGHRKYYKSDFAIDRYLFRGVPDHRLVGCCATVEKDASQWNTRIVLVPQLVEGRLFLHKDQYRRLYPPVPCLFACRDIRKGGQIRICAHDFAQPLLYSQPLSSLLASQPIQLPSQLELAIRAGIGIAAVVPTAALLGKVDFKNVDLLSMIQAPANVPDKWRRAVLFWLLNALATTLEDIDEHLLTDKQDPGDYWFLTGSKAQTTGGLAFEAGTVRDPLSGDPKPVDVLPLDTAWQVEAAKAARALLFHRVPVYYIHSPRDFYALIALARSAAQTYRGAPSISRHLVKARRMEEYENLQAPSAPLLSAQEAQLELAAQLAGSRPKKQKKSAKTPEQQLADKRADFLRREQHLTRSPAVVEQAVYRLCILPPPSPASSSSSSSSPAAAIRGLILAPNPDAISQRERNTQPLLAWVDVR